MKNVITYLKTLWRWGLDSQSSEVGFDCRLTVGSPSVKCGSTLMRLVAISAFLLTIGVGNVLGTPTVLFQETFGDNGNNNTAVASATCYTASKTSFTTGHQTTVAENYSSAGKVGKNSVQASDNTDASGNSAVWFQASKGTTTNTLFQVQNINISGYSSLSLKFNLKRSTGTSAQNAITVKYQIDSNTEQTLTYTVPSDDSWTWCTGDLTGTGSSLRITFSMATTGGYMSRLDDIILTGTEAAATPTLTVSESSISGLTYVQGSGPSTAQTFTVSGSDLSANVTVSAPTNFEVSKDGSSYAGSQTITASGTLSATTIYVRLKSGLAVNSYSGNITVASTGATSKTVSLSGSVTAPAYTVQFSTGTGNPTQADITEASAGAGITLPAGPTPACSDDGWSFAGWGYESCDDESTEPTLYIAGNKYYPSSNETLYAVYVKGKTASTNYKLISDAAQIVSGENYVIAAYYNSNDYAITAEIQSSYYIKQTAVTVTENVISSPGAKIIWQLTNEGGSNVSLYNSNQSKYLYVYASGSYRNLGLYDSKKQFTMTEEREAGYASTFAFNSTDYTSYYINYDASHTDFGTKTSSDENLYLYKRKYTGTYESNPTCCTPLGTINGSFTLSSTGTSVTATVTTAGGSAYEDAANVSGYEFKLYTAASGGSASASYSTNSSAGTSHTFTGLTPLTQYWVTVRPIGSGSYCNTTAESDRVAIYTCPGSPNHVDVSGRWDRFGGETISLTAAAYATAGTGTAIPAAKITGYQWQKWYNSQWNDISNAGTTSGATTNNLQITNCSNENSGSYRCVVSTVAGCDIASDGFQVKVYALECYNSGTTVYNFTRTGDTQAGTVQIDLSASTNYGYKVHADNDYYGNSGTVNEDVTNWEMSTGVSNNLTVASGLGGTFTFAIDYSTGGNNSTEGIPEISVTYPRKTIYLTPGVWNSGEAKFAFYYFRKVGETIYGEGFTDFITADDCGSSAEIPLWNGVKINAVRLNSNTTASDLTNSENHYKAAWDKKWNQTSDITITSNNSVSITGWGPDKEDSPYDYGTYAVPTYTISYATGSVPTGGGSISGSKANETKTCGVDFTLPAAQFTTTGYVQTGWSKADGGAQYAAVSGSYTDNSAQTFYPVWTANTHTLTWDKNGGDALTGDYTSGTVAYATAITAPNTPTWTGHTFGGWHNGTSIVTPATAMPDNDLTYTAQWSLATYTVTLNVNGGTINAGDVDEYTYGTGATLPTNVTRDGYRFDGWFTDDGVWSDQVTAISTTATGDKTYYAKWTQVYTVTWSVNGETWSSGVVEGNTHVPGSSKVSALPTAPTKSDCDDSKVFVGWKAAAIDGTSASNPGGIFTNVAGSPTISANTTFYAVFADEAGGDFTRVTNVSQLSAGKKVILGYEATANSGVIIPIQSSALNGTLLYTGTTEGSAGYGTLTISSMSAGDEAIYAFTIRAGYNSGYWAFEMSGDNAGKYLSHRGATNGKNSITSAESITSDGMTDFSIVVGTNDVATITNKWGNENTSKDGSNNYNYKILSYNYNNGSNPRAAIYRATQTGDFVIYLCNPLTYSNYVTSCSSCDADATFTNTTPAVSDIDCTSATLTATDGLATVGADGCHVSDYGFVIGTSDNPAIGGSGVEKLQVGTSDPTIGEDFSYDATGLTKGTRYYIRAYAINRHGTAYSSSTNFWTNNVSSIAITTAPTKTNYIVGETFDATGMVVTATMADSNTEDVTSDVTYSSSALTAGTSQNFAINYTLCETEKSVNQVINVYTLSVTEGTNDSYGTATNSSANIVSITGLGDHKTYTVTVTSSNATAVDNGDNTWSIINPTGNVTVRVDYADAVQVKVYYKVDGVTVTGLTQDVYQSETTTLPTASELATAMTAQSMDIPDDDYPNFIGWSETEFGAQTSEPTLVTGTPTINAEKTYYAVYTNLGQIHLSADNLVTTYPSTEKTVNVGSKDFKYHYLGDANISGTHVMQFKKHSSEYGYIYNNDALSNILRIEIGYYNSDSHVPVYAASAAGTIAGGALTPASRETTDPYVYTFPASTSYFMVKGDNSSTYKISYIDIYYASSTVYYMTQFCTRYTITGASTSGTAVTGGTLTSSYNSTCEGKSLTLSAAVTDGYAFEGWTITGASSGDMTSTLLGANASSVTPPAFTMPAENITVSATITEKEVTGWTWKQELADASEITIPATVELYIGQQAKFNLKTYDPADVLAGKKGYSADYTGTDLAQDSKAGAYYVTRAKIAKESTTLTLTSTSNGSVQEVITIRIKELPLVHFVDIIHGETFPDVVANVDASEKRTVYTTKPTPTHSAVDDPGASYNTCEQQHLHLIGWIESEWADAHPNAEPGDITGAGAGNYYAAGANIDLVAQNGKTFYAVWAKFE